MEIIMNLTAKQEAKGNLYTLPANAVQHYQHPCPRGYDSHLKGNPAFHGDVLGKAFQNRREHIANKPTKSSFLIDI